MQNKAKSLFCIIFEKYLENIFCEVDSTAKISIPVFCNNKNAFVTREPYPARRLYGNRFDQSGCRAECAGGISCRCHGDRRCSRAKSRYNNGFESSAASCPSKKKILHQTLRTLNFKIVELFQRKIRKMKHY